MAKREMRLIVDDEEFPDWSWLEQWDTPAKYYGKDKIPKCSHGVPMAYAEGNTFKSDLDNCEDCYDAEESTEIDPLGSTDGNSGVCLVDNQPVPFDEYKRTIGNPATHTMLDMRVEVRCPNCGEWSHAASLGNIDMIDGPMHYGTHTPEDVATWTGKDDYIKSQADELFREAEDAPECCKAVTLHLANATTVDMNVRPDSPLAAARDWTVVPLPTTNKRIAAAVKSTRKPKVKVRTRRK